jgi:hypothetical protein
MAALRQTIAAALACTALLGACSGEDPPTAPTTAPTTGPTSPAVDPPTTETGGGVAWHCHPEQADDLCLTADLATTAVDWTLAPTPDDPIPATDAAADCFYAHPTAADEAQARAWIEEEAARFRAVCRVFAPAYPSGDLSALEEAFDAYLAESGDRPFVLIGHGEGSDLLLRLTQARIDGDDALRGRLLSAMLVGGAPVSVPEGQVVGGTFQALPLCTDRDQTGCVISYHSYEIGTTPALGAPPFAGLAPGMRAACTHPAGLDGSRGQLRDAVFATSSALAPGPTTPGLPPVDTPFVSLPEYFVAECVNFGGGVWYLRVEPSIDPDDARAPGPLTDPALGEARLGTQHLDVALAIGDLLFLIERQLAARA